MCDPGVSTFPEPHKVHGRPTMSMRFLILDVFTDRPFGGNQLAVFPEAADIDEALLQPIARELDFSETVFVYPLREDGAVRMRIFTPEAEIPFAGHPVIGTAFALDEFADAPPRDGDVLFELESGEINVRRQRAADGSLLQATMSQHRPVFLAETAQVESVARALGIEPRDILITGLPCEVVSTGLPFHVVPVGSLQAMRSLQPDFKRLRMLGEELGVSDVYVFCFDTVDSDATVHARMFAPSYGIPEDAATGSAAGCLGAYVVKNRAVPAARLTKLVVEQGLELGRPSRLFVEVENENDRIVGVRVGGTAVIVGEGELRL